MIPMRMSTHDTKWILGPKGELLGIQGGFDFAAEHEWGISGILDAFDCDLNADGMERRRFRRIPNRFVRVSNEDCNGLFLMKGLESYYRNPDSYIKEWRSTSRGRGGLVFAWDADTFGLMDFTLEGKTRVDELHEAFLRGDVAIGRGAGLTFKILSRISKEECNEVLASDLDRRALETAAMKTGIEKELRAAGKSWYGLKPAWADEKKTVVRFFLNPVDQHINNFGWFTVDELRLWARGKGPVPKARAER